MIAETPEILKYSKNKQKWELFDYKNPQSSIQYKTCVQNLHTLTFNVLTDCIWEAPLKRSILFSKQRYIYILTSLSHIKHDIVTFNQVTLNFYSILCQMQWIKSQYFITQFNHQQKDGSSNVLISKIKPQWFWSIQIDNLPRKVLTIGFKIIQNQEKYATVTCAHLTSLTKNRERRQNELKDILKKLNNLSDQKKIKRQDIIHIIQGDLNIHEQSQNIIMKEMNLKDTWLQYHKGIIRNNLEINQGSEQQIEKQILSQFPGYTFDAQINNLIKEVYWGFEKRRMRLDRILYTTTPRIQPKITGTKIIFNKQISQQLNEQQQRQPTEYPQMGYSKGIISLVGDIFGYNIFRQKQKYLFPSDHFGLECNISFIKKQ